MTKLEEAVKEIFDLLQDDLAIFKLGNICYIGFQNGVKSNFSVISENTYEAIIKCLSEVRKYD